MSTHIPVLEKEVIALLNLKRGENAIDATLDGGGHARAMLKEITPGGKVLGIDRDPKMIEKIGHEKNLIAVCGNFTEIDEIAEKNNFRKVGAILFDLGLSTWHLKASGRGFSFQKPEEPLLMNFGGDYGNSAAEIVNGYKEESLAEIFKAYGEEPRARLIAKRIAENRKTKRIISVGDLLEAVGISDKKILARIFQALRIAVNNELENLKEGLDRGFKILNRGGRMAVISYHSLEDRIVKIFFSAKGRSASGGKTEAEIMTKKPVAPLHEEILKNPSARSAKLRVLKKI